MLRLEIVTPEKRVLDSEVDFVTVPTASGEVGILPNHAPLISAVKPGILSYSLKGSATRLAVSRGFIEVNTDKVAVLVDAAETADEIDIESARSARDDAEKALKAAAQAPADDNAEYRESFEHAAARLQIAASK